MRTHSIGHVVGALRHTFHSLGACVLASVCLAPLAASDLDEFKIKREEVFEFTQKPLVTRSGDTVTVTFGSKAYCDVTVAVENAQGSIVRHLASGVLGPRVPEPLQANTLLQTLVWDGKNDQGAYIDDKDTHVIRVSLGLKPQFEKNLLWEPKKRLARAPVQFGARAALPTPIIQAGPEGVYVFEGYGVDNLRLFDHEGNYARTVYPFPADKIDAVQGLTRQTFPQDGLSRPIKLGFFQSTMLTSGITSHLTSATAHPPTNRPPPLHCYSVMFGSAANAMAVQNGRIALAQYFLNRLSSDGSTGGLPLEGPKTYFPVRLIDRNRSKEDCSAVVGPTSAAFSPDGRWLYLAGYMWREGVSGQSIDKGCLHGVVRIPYDDPKALAEVFVGSMKPDDSGTDNAHFRDATSVACDTQGRVYVSDYVNDRIQVYTPDGKHVKSIAVRRPARIAIHQRTNEIYVFSWILDSVCSVKAQDKDVKDFKPTFTRLGPLEDPRKRAEYPLPLYGASARYDLNWELWGGLHHYVALDSWTEPPTLWLVPGTPGDESKTGIRLLVEKNGALEVKRDFAQDAQRTVTRLTPPFFSRQRLYVNPRNGRLYVGEGQTAWYKAFNDVLEIDPETGKVKVVPLPFDAEDMAFDLNGLAYLRAYTFLARYDPETWREVPFDYGEERRNVGSSTSRDGRKADVQSGIPLYGRWHTGGISVSPRGTIAVECNVTKGDSVPVTYKRTDEENVSSADSKISAPPLYPGRLRFGEIHLYNSKGQEINADAVPGVTELYGVALDRNDDVYLLGSPTRILDGKPYLNEMSGTLMKFKAGKGRWICASKGKLVGVPLEDRRPERAPDAVGPLTRDVWVEGSEWMYGGVGYMGRNANVGGSCCSCWNDRFTLDAFSRTFAPEVDRYSVAVLDANGNLILHLGRYGNADSAGPRSPVPLGGDEVGFFSPQYLATQTDRRLFVADPGNARIVSVRLNYHASERVPLRSIPDGARTSNR